MKSNLLAKVNNENEAKTKIEYIEKFELAKMNVIVSIIGGEDYLSFSKKISIKLKKELAKLTETVKTLFITDGLNVAFKLCFK